MDASVEFLKYMLSEKVQKRILLETGQMPSSPKIHLEEYKEQIPRMCNAVEAIRAASYHENGMALFINMTKQR